MAAAAVAGSFPRPAGNEYQSSQGNDLSAVPAPQGRPPQFPAFGESHSGIGKAYELEKERQGIAAGESSLSLFSPGGTLG